MRKLRVLVVDDDPIVLEAVRGLLESAGYDVVCREQALGTSHWIVQNRPEIVLLDVMMPALSGHELTALLKKRGVEAVVILHSSKSAAELSRMAHESGATGSIQKTSNSSAFLREFERIVQSALGTRRGSST